MKSRWFLLAAAAALASGLVSGFLFRASDGNGAGSVLPAPAAYTAHVKPGCVWGDGTKDRTITRKSGQMFNIVNDDTLPHKFKQVSGPLTALPYWSLKKDMSFGMSYTAVGRDFVFSTCSGTLKLTIKVSG